MRLLYAARLVAGRLRRAQLERLTSTYQIPWDENALWEQLTLFGPSFAKHEPRRPIQLDLAAGIWNAAAVETSEVLKRLCYQVSVPAA
jgi:hypothetical protein